MVDQWFYFIKEEYQGRGLLRKMVAASEYLAGLQNYQYSVCWASNYKTAKTMKKLGYLLIG